MVRNHSLLQKAEKLRREGKSYSKINKQLGVSKGTLSNWFSNKKWSQSIKVQLICKNKKRSSNYLIRINKLRRLETLQRHDRYRKEASVEFETLRHDPLFMVGLSIYWGEGEKINKGRVSVINTDADLLKVVVNFYKRSLKVPNSKLRGALFIHKDIVQSEALKFWSRRTKIPKSQFIKTQVLPSRSTLTKRKLANGICTVYFSSTEMNVKIKEWIRLMAIEMRE